MRSFGDRSSQTAKIEGGVPSFRPGGRGGRMLRYRAVSIRLRDEFKAELRRIIAMAVDNPNRFHPIKPGFHRANLKRFPYHLIYREVSEGIRVILVRHH